MVITVALFVISLLFIMAWLSKSGHAPGLSNDSLTPCPNKPNCICSEYDQDTPHYLAPLPIPAAKMPSAMHAIEVSITSLGGEIQTQDDHYLAATFSSSFFGFIDDVELRIDSDKHLIHIRSAARIGHSDFGVNQKRARALKASLRQHFEQTANSSSS